MALEHEGYACASKPPYAGSNPVRATTIRIENMIMTEKEIEESRRWAANGAQPIDRDVQIFLMETAEQRHQNHINKIMKLIEEKGKGL